MNKILISGLINIETTVKIESFPIEYSPVNYDFYGIETTVSGVAYNVAKAIRTLGGEPTIMSLIGKDIYEPLILEELKRDKLNNTYIKSVLEAIPQAVILYDDSGKRSIRLDLKDIQNYKYPKEESEAALEGIDMVVACNINFSRDLLRQAKKAGKIIATDVHVLENLEDEYNQDFLENADILFLSNEAIIDEEEAFIQQLALSYKNDIIVIGMGNKGAMIYVREDEDIKIFPAISTRKVISTIGAGDALFASFIYFYNKTRDPYQSLKTAILFASYKIGEKGAASGFLEEAELLKLQLVNYS